MTIKIANNIVRKLENDLWLYCHQKELAFQKTQPHSSDPNKVNVQGGQKSNMMDDYVISIDELNKKIKDTKKKIKIYEIYISKELERANEFEPIKAKIIELRNKGLSWKKVSSQTYYSESWCRKVYHEY